MAKSDWLKKAAWGLAAVSAPLYAVTTDPVMTSVGGLLIVTVVVMLLVARRAKWNEELRLFCRDYLPDLAHALDRAYIQLAGAPFDSWRELVVSLGWPEVRLGQNLASWKQQHLSSLDDNSRLALGLAQSIYAEGVGPLRSRSVLDHESYERLDRARGQLKDLCECWGKRRRIAGFGRFLDREVYDNYWGVIKLLAYLEIALATAIPTQSGLKSTQMGLWRLGDRWAENT